MRRKFYFSVVAEKFSRELINSTSNLMVFEFQKLNISITDNDFDAIYPEKIRMLGRKHWSSVSASKLASEFLIQSPGTRVLGIGSGAGKFCMIGATNTKGHFTGVEQRLELVKFSRRISDSASIT